MSGLYKLWKEDWKTILILLVVGGILSIIVYLFPAFQHLVEIAAAILAVIALIFAMKQYLDTRKQTDTLGEHAKTLETIYQSMSTKYLGEFPDFIPEITALVERAQRQLIIFCDVAIYGRIRAPEYFYNYKRSIEAKLGKRSFKIQYIHLNDHELNNMFHEQFPRNVWESWRDGHPEFLEDFLEGTDYSLNNLDYYDFLDICMKRNKALLENEDIFSHSRVEREESHLPMSMCFWISDEDQEAILSLISFTGTGEVREFGFYTVDGRLIKALHSIFERYRNLIRLQQGAEAPKKAGD